MSDIVQKIETIRAETTHTVDDLADFWAVKIERQSASTRAAATDRTGHEVQTAVEDVGDTLRESPDPLLADVEDHFTPPNGAYMRVSVDGGDVEVWAKTGRGQHTVFLEDVFATTQQQFRKVPERV